MCRDCKPELQMMYAGSKLALVEQVPLDATEMNMNLLVKLCCKSVTALTIYMVQC